PALATLRARNDARRAVFEVRRQSVDERSGRLDDVVVRGDQVVLHGGFLLLARGLIRTPVTETGRSGPCAPGSNRVSGDHGFCRRIQRRGGATVDGALRVDVYRRLGLARREARRTGSTHAA